MRYSSSYWLSTTLCIRYFPQASSFAEQPRNTWLSSDLSANCTLTGVSLASQIYYGYSLPVPKYKFSILGSTLHFLPSQSVSRWPTQAYSGDACWIIGTSKKWWLSASDGTYEASCLKVGQRWHSRGISYCEEYRENSKLHPKFWNWYTYDAQAYNSNSNSAATLYCSTDTPSNSSTTLH
jgi:hypothetical protein